MPLSNSDRLEILDLYARYNQEADIGSPEAWALLYTDDGEFHRVTDMAGLGEVPGVVKGTEALVDLGRNFRKSFPHYRHWVNSITINGGGDRASGRCYLMMYELVEDGVRLIGHGRYEDDLERCDRGWCFSRRVATVND